jgi:hypothetical protein
MIPRLRELMNAGCTSQKRRLRNPLLYAKAAAVSRRRLGHKRIQAYIEEFAPDR